MQLRVGGGEYLDGEDGSIGCARGSNGKCGHRDALWHLDDREQRIE